MRVLSTVGLTVGLAACMSGCAAFSNVRSAAVTPGPSITLQASATQPVGDETGWFFSFDCATNCGHPIISPALSIAFGQVPDSGNAYALGLGLNGFLPYAEAYLQTSRSPSHPIGLGARAGLMENARQLELYGRANFPWRRSTLFWNPGLFAHWTVSPNPARMIALVNGFGLQMGDGPAVVTPSVSIVASRAQKTGARPQPPGFPTEQHPVERLVFAQAAVSITWRQVPARGAARQ